MIAPNAAPYPGLRPFNRNESHLFFGRDDTVDAMIARLAATRFLAVLGSSGTGKSSLVRTGLWSGLEMGLLRGAGARWQIVDFRPGGQPFANLARRLLETEASKLTVRQLPETADADSLKTRLSQGGPRTLIGWCREGHLPAGTNLLLLVDQFEELFRYQDYEEREEAEAFVSLLLESRCPIEVESPQSASFPIYVTITMRSEYLGACALIEGLAEAINEGTFLTPRMTRQQCREAIVGPARVCGIDIEDALVARVLNDLAEFATWEDRGALGRSDGGDKADKQGRRDDQLSRLARRADQLPLMQHALNRMWEEAKGRSGTKGLTLADYERVGGLQGALDRHANSILKQLEASIGKDRADRTTETVFRALTFGSTVADSVRRPTSSGNLANISGDREGVRAVVEAFRAPGCNFLMPERSVTLLDDTHVDITHESLIRQWYRLSEWLDHEARAAQTWYRLKDAAASYRRHEGALLEGRTLESVLGWRDQTRPNAAWAARYGDDYADVMSFLAESIQASQKRMRQKKLAGVAAGALCLAVVAAGGYLYRQQQMRLAAERMGETAIAAEQRIEKNIGDTVGYSLLKIATGLQDYQSQGKWDSARDVLGYYAREVSVLLAKNAVSLDRAASEPIYWRALEQYVRGTPRTSSPQDLATNQPRFGLRASGSALSLVDKSSGAILKRVILSQFFDYRSTGIDNFRGKQIPNESQDLAQFVSVDGQHVVVILASGKVIHWSIADNEATEIFFDQDHDTSHAVIKRADAVSIAFESASNRAALIVTSKEQPGGRLLFSRLRDFEPDRSVVLSSVLGRFGSDLSEICKQRWNAPDFDIIDARVVSFVGDRAVVQLHNRTRPDGIVSISAEGGAPQNLLIWTTLVNLPLTTPDGNAIVHAAGWSPGDECNAISGNLDVPPAADNSEMAYSPGEYLIVSDVATARNTLAAVVPAGSQVTKIAAAPPGLHGERRYVVNVAAMGESHVLVLEATGGGNYRVVAGDHPPQRPAEPSDERLPQAATWPLPVPDSFGQAKGRNGWLIFSWQKSGASSLQRSVVMSSYPARGSVAGPLHFGLAPNQIATRAIDTSGIDLSRRISTGFDPEAQALWLLGYAPNSDNNSQSKSENGTPPESAPELRGAIVNFNSHRTGADEAWLPVITDFCPQSQSRGAVVFVDIRYWGREAVKGRTDLAEMPAAFIAVDDKSRLWKISLTSDRRSIALKCLASFHQDASILDVDTAQGRAAVKSNFIYVYSLAVPSQPSSGVYPRTVVGLAEPPVAAAFVAPSKLLLATEEGDLFLAQDEGTGADWEPKLLLKGVVSRLSAVVADGSSVLITAENGYAIAFKFDGNVLQPVAVTNLPHGETSRKIFNSKERTVDLLRDEDLQKAGYVQRISMTSPPSEEYLARYFDSRGGKVEKNDEDLVKLLKTLFGNDASLALSLPLVSVDAAARCRLAIGALLTVAQSVFDDVEPPLDRVRGPRGFARQQCAEVSDPAVRAKSDLILAASGVDSGGSTIVAWPQAWSRLLGAAQRGDRLAARAFLIALKQSGNKYVAIAAGAAWRRLLESGALLVAQISMGDDIAESIQKRLEAGRDSLEPETHLLLGYLLERRVDDPISRAQALFHFWIAEELFHASNRPQEQATAGIRRAQLAQALPDETVTSVRNEVGAWTGGSRAATDEGPPAVATDPGPAARLAQDIRAIESLGAAVADNQAFLALKASLLWILADIQMTGDADQARQTYSFAVKSIEDIVKISDASFIRVVSDWSTKLLEINENALAYRMMSKALLLYDEMGAAPFDDGTRQDYTHLITNLRSGLESGKLSINDARTWLTFAFEPFGDFARDTTDVHRLALTEKLALLNSLLTRMPEEPSWIAHRGATEYWLAAMAMGRNPEGKQYIDTAINDLGRAVQAGAADPSVTFLLAEAELLKAYSMPDGSPEAISLYSAAKRDYATVVAAIKTGWSPPLGVGRLYANYTLTMENLTLQFYSMIKDSRDRWDPQDPGVLDAIWQSLDNARQRDRMRQRTAGSEAWWSIFNPGLGSGLTVAGLTGHLRLVDQSNRAANQGNACDEAASSPMDPLRRSYSVSGTQLAEKGDEAATACQNMSMSSRTDLPHYQFLQARVHDIVSGKTSNIDEYAQPARDGYAAAFYTFAYYVNSNLYKRRDYTDTAYNLRDNMLHGYEQRVLLSSFPLAYAFLKDHGADNADHRASLQWIAEKAAAAGSIEGHIAVADLTGTVAEKWFHLEVAAKLEDKRGDKGAEAASELRASADQLGLSQPDIARQQPRVDAWVSEPLIELPSDISDRMRRLE